MVLPFFQDVPLPGIDEDEESLRKLFLWATAIVSAYSFELGENKLQVGPHPFLQRLACLASVFHTGKGPDSAHSKI
jgi:hypothetical protein